MVRQQVGGEVQKVLQVAVATDVPPEDGEDLEPIRVGKSLEHIDSLFKRCCIKNY